MLYNAPVAYDSDCAYDTVGPLVGQEIVEGTLTVRDVLRIMLAALAGQVTGAGTGTELFKSQDGTVNRITSTVDSSGNRTTVVVDGA